ncbi:uncharacterized protein LOC132066284 [Lycium ferocissimum]|uniref:uncharacterized protein LOC132066284 n=1 Tax=Lycium ferocissimum TaxID=112874 RepID=UPI0028169007|nr:uncharacterized protein LOC132066284 [Lycium ferocissimum]
MSLISPRNKPKYNTSRDVLKYQQMRRTVFIEVSNEEDCQTVWAIEKEKQQKLKGNSEDKGAENEQSNNHNEGKGSKNNENNDKGQDNEKRQAKYDNPIVQQNNTKNNKEDKQEQHLEQDGGNNPKEKSKNVQQQEATEQGSKIEQLQTGVKETKKKGRRPRLKRKNLAAKNLKNLFFSKAVRKRQTPGDQEQDHELISTKHDEKKKEHGGRNGAE